MALSIVPESPYHSQLESLDVGKKTAARHTEQLISNVSFLQGRNVEHITTSFPTSASLVQDNTNAPAGYSTVYTFFYQKSPGVNLLNVELEMMANRTNNSSYNDSKYWLFAEFELPTSTSFIPGHNLHEARFAPKMLEEPWTDTSQVGLIDVSALDPDTVYKFHITGTAYDQSSTAASFNSEYLDGGFQRISVMEMPTFLLDVGTVAGANTGSVDTVWATPYRRIVEGVRDDSGGTTAGYGFVRLVDQTQQSLCRWRNCWQIVNHEGTAAVDGMNNVWRIPAGSSFDPIDFRVPGFTAAEQEFWIRTRNYYGSATTQTNSYRLYVRHRGAAGFIDLNFESEPNSVTGVSSVYLPASTGWTTTTLDVDLPCDTWFIDKEQLVRFWFTGDAYSGDLYIATLALIENEPNPATIPT